MNYTAYANWCQAKLFIRHNNCVNILLNTTRIDEQIFKNEFRILESKQWTFILKKSSDKSDDSNIKNQKILMKVFQTWSMKHSG